MRTTTLQFQVYGDNYEDIIKKVESTIGMFFRNHHDEDDLDEEFVDESYKSDVNWDVFVSPTNDAASDYDYVAEVTARIKENTR